jgi:hypothetical protein
MSGRRPYVTVRCFLTPVTDWQMRDELGKLGIQEKDTNLLNPPEYKAIVEVCYAQDSGFN